MSVSSKEGSPLLKGVRALRSFFQSAAQHHVMRQLLGVGSAVRGLAGKNLGPILAAVFQVAVQKFQAVRLVLRLTFSHLGAHSRVDRFAVLLSVTPRSRSELFGVLPVRLSIFGLLRPDLLSVCEVVA